MILFYPVDFHMSVDLTAFIQCQQFCLAILVDVVFALTLFEFVGIWIPSLLPVCIDNILTRITAMRVVQFGPVTIAARWLIGRCCYCICRLQRVVTRKKEHFENYFHHMHNLP